MKPEKITGLIAAGLSPLYADGSINLAQIPVLVDHLIGHQIAGIYICGSTGEGPLLTGEERKKVAEAYIQAASGRIPTLVQVGHNSTEESCELAAHAAAAGADYLSACAPGYFKPTTVDSLVDCMAEIASAAPDKPFYYYHIPHLTGANLDMVEFLRQSQQRIPSLVGIKYSDVKLFEFQSCIAFDHGRYDILWGCDEMLLGALATGAKAAVGSTYNLAAPLYHEVIQAFNAGDMATAQRWMLRAVEVVYCINGRHGPLLPSIKHILGELGIECGASRLPIGGLDADAKTALIAELKSMGFFDWISLPTV
jgi:N-acetylneuraminate lyase